VLIALAGKPQRIVDEADGGYFAGLPAERQLGRHSMTEFARIEASAELRIFHRLRGPIRCRGYWLAASEPPKSAKSAMTTAAEKANAAIRG
jgi:hypothetical protein